MTLSDKGQKESWHCAKKWGLSIYLLDLKKNLWVAIDNRRRRPVAELEEAGERLSMGKPTF